MLRDNQNMFPHVQERILKRFIEKQMGKLKELKEQAVETELIEETFNELLAAHKELCEMTLTMSDKLGFLC